MFAGVGGMTLGFKQAGYEISWANEFDRNACKTYRVNFSDHRLYEDSVVDLDPKELGYVDVLTSGFPCQAFSIAGHREGFNDSKGRGNLFFETARFIDELRPRAFLLENVKNLKSHDKGRTFEVIKNTIENELGYSFIHFVLNGFIHGNTPQNRERVYMVGFRDEAGMPPYADPIPLMYTKEMQASKTFRFQKPEKLVLTTSVRNVVDWRRKPSKYYFPKDHKYMPLLTKTIKSKDTLYQWRRTLVRENKKGVCPTLTANMGCGGHNVPLLVDNWGYRKLVPRECFRFQGFPEDFILPEDVSDTQLYKQAGNSVVVPIIKRIALAISERLKYEDKFDKNEEVERR
jgi:DNA (cytosine-5)-methyltransferase 1